jgi:hypothetical protein
MGSDDKKKKKKHLTNKSKGQHTINLFNGRASRFCWKRGESKKILAVGMLFVIIIFNCTQSLTQESMLSLVALCDFLIRVCELKQHLFNSFLILSFCTFLHFLF